MTRPPTVIVPSYNRASQLAELLGSLERQTIEHEVVVVDNASTDGTPELVASRFPRVRVVRLPNNVGFGRAINRGVGECDARTVVFLNNDVVCEPPFLQRLCDALDPSAGVVMAAGVLLAFADPTRIDSAGIVFDRSLFAYDYLHGEEVSALDAGVPDPLGPSGGAAAFDRAAFEDVGGIDERFFAYLEDVDLAARMISAGASCRLASGARALHRHAATLGSGSRRKNELMGWGRGYTLAKYRIHRLPRLFVPAALAELVIAGGQLVVDRTAVGFRARLAGFRAGLGVPPQPLPGLPAGGRHASTLSVLSHRLPRRTSPRLAA